MKNIIQMLKTMLIYNYRFAYSMNQSNNIIGFGLIDTDNYYLTNFSYGEVEYNNMGNRIIIDPSEYVSLAIINKSENIMKTGFIWSKIHISDETDICTICQTNPDKSQILNFDNKNLKKLPDYYVDIYGLKNKLFFDIEYLNKLTINQINNHNQIKHILDIWFRYNLFETSCIYKSNGIIKSTFYDQNNSLSFINQNSNTNTNSTIIDLFFKLGTFDSDKKIDIINSVLKSYNKNYNIMMICSNGSIKTSNNNNLYHQDLPPRSCGCKDLPPRSCGCKDLLPRSCGCKDLLPRSCGCKDQENKSKQNDETTIIINKFIENNKINIVGHNLLFTYNYPILLYSNYETI